MDTLAFPLRFENNEIVKHVQGTDSYYNQLIATTLQIEPGEMSLELGFGIKNMIFDRPSSGNIQQALNYYFPELYIDAVNVSQSRRTSDFNVTVSYAQ